MELSTEAITAAVERSGDAQRKRERERLRRDEQLTRKKQQLSQHVAEWQRLFPVETKPR